jgi:hypothetical protein
MKIQVSQVCKLLCAVRFEVSMVVKVQVKVLWVMKPCSVVEYQCFERCCCLNLQGEVCDAGEWT